MPNPLFKPMLAHSKLPDFTKIKFPVYVSPKLDGIRATMQGGQLLSRTLKPIPNKAVQDLFRTLPEGTDGELIKGDPADDPYKRTHSTVMSEDKPADGVQLYVFDRFDYTADPGFQHRYNRIRALGLESLFEVTVVPHFLVSSIELLEQYEAHFLTKGYEGLMIRSVAGPYKQGRSSEKEGWLMKVKRYEDAEAVIVEAYEEMENNNEEFTNELGRTARSNHKENKVGKNQLGGFHVVGVGGKWDGVAFDVS